MRTPSKTDWPPWSFTVSEAPLTEDEQSRFEQDLAGMGTDRNVFRLLNGLLSVRSRNTAPKVLRGYRDGQFSGAAWFFECRKPGRSFFGDGPLASLMDAPRIPSFLWLRYGVLPDHFSNPGFVVAGVERNDFVSSAVRALQRTYLYGSTVDFMDSPEPVPAALRYQAADNGFVTIASGATIDDFIRTSSQLRKKINKYRNKGGQIRIVKGPLPTELAGRLVGFFETMSFLVQLPYQEIYLPLVAAALTHDDDDVVHFVAEIEGEPVGYHSFYQSGSSLRCLSGGFDRTRQSNWHAYENLILSSISYSIDNGLNEINYGPVLNETKKKLMNDFRPIEIRTWVRYPILGSVMPWLIERSNLRKDVYADFVDIGAQPNPAVTR